MGIGETDTSRVQGSTNVQAGAGRCRCSSPIINFPFPSRGPHASHFTPHEPSRRPYPVVASSCTESRASELPDDDNTLSSTTAASLGIAISLHHYLAISLSLSSPALSRRISPVDILRAVTRTYCKYPHLRNPAASKSKSKSKPESKSRSKSYIAAIITTAPSPRLAQTK